MCMQCDFVAILLYFCGNDVGITEVNTCAILCKNRYNFARFQPYKPQGLVMYQNMQNMFTLKSAFSVKCKI